MLFLNQHQTQFGKQTKQKKIGRSIRGKKNRRNIGGGGRYFDWLLAASTCTQKPINTAGDLTVSAHHIFRKLNLPVWRRVSKSPVYHPANAPSKRRVRSKIKGKFVFFKKKNRLAWQSKSKERENATNNKPPINGRHVFCFDWSTVYI